MGQARYAEEGSGPIAISVRAWALHSAWPGQPTSLGRRLHLGHFAENHADEADEAAEEEEEEGAATAAATAAAAAHLSAAYLPC